MAEQKMGIDVVVLMGSKNDMKYFDGAKAVFEQFKIDHVFRTLSAHRCPEDVQRFVKDTAAAGTKVFIAAAGGAAHLAGAVAAHTIKPVLGVPLPSSPLSGMDALLATVQMPSGIPVGTLSVGEWGAKNAALLAIEILALNRSDLHDQLIAYRAQMREKVLQG